MRSARRTTLSSSHADLRVPLPQRHTFEVIQSMSDDPVATCEECGAPVERVFRPVAVFQGSGSTRPTTGLPGGCRQGRRTSSGDSGLRYRVVDFGLRRIRRPRKAAATRPLRSQARLSGQTRNVWRTLTRRALGLMGRVAAGQLPDGSHTRALRDEDAAGRTGAGAALSPSTFDSPLPPRIAAIAT